MGEVRNVVFTDVREISYVNENIWEYEVDGTYEEYDAAGWHDGSFENVRMSSAMAPADYLNSAIKRALIQWIQDNKVVEPEPVCDRPELVDILNQAIVTHLGLSCAVDRAIKLIEMETIPCDWRSKL